MVTDIAFTSKKFLSPWASIPIPQGERTTYLTGFSRPSLADAEAFQDSLVSLSHETLHFVLADMGETGASEGIDRGNINLDIEVTLGWTSIPNYTSFFDSVD